VRNDTGILLPAATIDLFLKDKPTIDVAKALSADWRFARVTLRVYQGGVKDAIGLYATQASPDMILVETDTTDDAFVNALGDLSARCDEKTSAVVIGPVNDVNLYRSLTAMGVSDYLVRPVPQDILGEVIAGCLIEKLGTAGSHLIAVVGAKGGVGTSAIAQILATTAAQTLGQKCFLFDASCGWSSLPVTMGFEPSFSINEAVRAVTANDTASFQRMVFQAHERLSVLATGSEPLLETSITPQSFEDLLTMIMANNPLVIADLSGAAPSVKKAMMARAHLTVMVTTPCLSALRLARGLLQEMRKITGNDANKIALALNMVGFATGKEIAKSDIAEALDLPPTITIPFDPKLFWGVENDGESLSQHKNGQGLIDAVTPLLQKVVGRESTAYDKSDDSGLIGSFLTKLKPKK